MTGADDTTPDDTATHDTAKDDPAPDDSAANDTAPDAARAETYLRLQAEHELRQALALRRWQPTRAQRRPRQRRGFAVWGAQSQLVAGWSGTRPASVRARMRFAVPGVRWPAPLVRAAQSAVGLLSAIAMHAAARFSRPEEPLPAYANLNRVTKLAGALAGAGVIDDTTAGSVVADLRAALAMRELVSPSELFEEFRAASWHRLRHRVLAPASPIRAFAVGVIVDCVLAGHPARVYLGALLIDSRHGMISVHATVPGDQGHRPRHRPPALEALETITATDDQGGSYTAYFSGGCSPERWDGQLTFDAPPAKARWLDIDVPGSNPVRVDLTASAVGWQTTSRLLPPAPTADSYLDLLTTQMLSNDWTGSGWVEDPDVAWPEAVTAAAGLLAAGVLTEANPALGRVVAAARQLRRRLPQTLVAIQPATLPADWQALIARREAADGPSGMVTVGAVLPELAGARCVIIEVESAAESAMFRVHAYGWPSAFYGPGMPFRGPISLHWTARDDVGGWYTATEQGGSYGDSEADLELALFPPINPLASELEITLSDTAGEVSVTVPLRWQERL